MADTFNKKERNKKKLQKRKEKEQRREEKRHDASGKGKSLEDMIAYVDENGNISNTPPDPSKAKAVDPEDIVIGVPKAEPEDPDAVPTGVVTYFDESKGYGFISNSKTEERVFVHVNQLAEPNTVLAAGDKVEYTVVKGPRGLQAESVRKV